MRVYAYKVPVLPLALRFRGRPSGAHVTMTYDDRQLLGTVVDFFYTDVAGWLLEVRHFNGEPWPLMPCAGAVEVIPRS